MVKVNTQLFQGVNMDAIVQVDRRFWEMYHSSIDLFNMRFVLLAIPLREDNGSYIITWEQ